MSEAPSNQKPQSPPGRIPIHLIELREPIDLPNGNAIVTRIECGPAVPGRQYFVAHFVPSHQVIELECYKNSTSEPHRTRIPLAAVKRFD